MRSPIVSLALLGMIAVASACGGAAAPATNTAAVNTAKPAVANTNTAAAPAANTNTAAAATPAGAGEKSNLAIKNTSKWEIHHLYMAPSNTTEWGPDQLGDQTIKTGNSFTINNIPCNTYDIRVVDEDGDECIIEDEKFCGHEATWDLSDAELLKCEEKTAK